MEMQGERRTMVIMDQLVGQKFLLGLIVMTTLRTLISLKQMEGSLLDIAQTAQYSKRKIKWQEYD